MRGGTGATATLGLAGRVQQALAADATMSTPAAGAHSSHPRWLRPVAGGVIAASVALVAVLSVNALRETETEPLPALAAADQPATPAAAAAVAQLGEPAGEQWERLDPRIDKRLSGYLMNHNEYAASRGVQGVMPYVRIVGYDTSR